MSKKIKKEKVEKEKNETAEVLFISALNMLIALKSKTRLTDKDKTRFTCEMTEEAFDALSAFIRKHTKKER